MNSVVTPKSSILFVCLGNICRSPMAEAVFRHKLGEKNMLDRYVIDSAGTSAGHAGEPPHPGTIEVLSRNGISWEWMKARRFSLEDFNRFDLIIPLDRDNKRDIEHLADRHGFDIPDLRLLLSYGRSAPGAHIDCPDPWYTGDFDGVFSLISGACDGLIEELVRNRLHP